jgi:nucleotide-binding universal stress UspA family protein
LTERAILQLADELPADLIIMGTHGRGGLKHMLIGSTTERILADSSRPVLAVRGSEDDRRFLETDTGIRTLRPEVVVPIDFSPHSLYTLEHAYRLATIMPITLHLLHVVQPMSWDDMHGMGHFNVPEFQRSRILEAKERLRLLIPEDLAGRVQVHVRMGPVVAEITGLAEAIQAGLIVMGITPGGIIEDLLFGAVAYGVLRGSPCPVWVVPGGHAQRDRIRHEEKRLSDIPQTLLKTS